MTGFSAWALARLGFLGITFLLFFCRPDYHGLWHSVMSICLPTEVEQQCATLVLGWVTNSVHYCCHSEGFAAHASTPKHLLAFFHRFSKIIYIMAMWFL